MKGENYEGKRGLSTHGCTAPWQQPVKDRFQSPGEAGMVIDDLIFFAAQAVKSINSDNEAAEKDYKSKPQCRSG